MIIYIKYKILFQMLLRNKIKYSNVNFNQIYIICNKKNEIIYNKSIIFSLGCFIGNTEYGKQRKKTCHWL